MAGDPQEWSSTDEPVEVIVQLRADVADALRDETPPSLQARALLEAAAAAGVSLAPVHPGASDPESASYYRFDARNVEDAARVVEALRATDAVEAAYPKPRAFPPG